ncbi:SsrA-binding protein SmpB [Coxiella endosymbiont of Amblyomma sculptum]|uniref:SsrA-binding protein SmpB n=1 Tax=Coxiella endosymbiont of Amblyomma sculptum TaxID=2487929 RepID=UPI00132E926E|nr:SsrA-binding protein SmpB [Coxiella endosymbiont of Amblyomma sculptum]QHG92506.1 SsrA-binding protein SmpB [Coxiella endosymbiont of Amblyomma sculptum]
MEKSALHVIVLNKTILYRFYVEQQLEAGLVLEGWEVKSIRAGHIQLRDSYITLKNAEAWLIESHCSPLSNTTLRVKFDPKRPRKLLLKKYEIRRLFNTVQKKQFTIVPLDFHWYKNRIKTTIALVRGKKMYDKRETIKRREWERKRHNVFV